MRPDDPRYGKGAIRIPTEQVRAAGLSTVEARLVNTFRAPTYRPPVLPATAMELVRISRDPNVDFRAVTRLLEQEPLLAARVLRVAQSPVFGAAEPVLSLSHAATRLGLRTLADVFLAEAMALRVFRAPGYDAPMERLRRHSLATAHIARMVARRTALSDEHAFLCGLLHDCGIAAGIIAIADAPRGEVRVPWNELWPALHRGHEVYAFLLSKLWELPEDVSLVISRHHQLKWGKFVHPGAAVICVADGISREVDHGFDDEADAREFTEAAHALSLNTQVLGVIREEARAALPSLLA
jgi:HD-like signal output (HDOD) protein